MIDMQTFLSNFQSVKKISGGYMVKCPCHNDKTASLSVGMGEKGIVLHCMAGCDSSDIVRALGLTWRDLCTDEVQREWQTAHPAGAAKTQQKAQKSTKPAAEITTKPPKKIPADLNRLKIGGTYAQKDAPPETITAMYEYTDADGAPLLRVYRTDKKSFPTIHCDGGKWFWGDGGRHNVLYHLPEVVKAVQDGKKVLIVEGEKDVETLRTLGYAATTNKGGAGKWSEELSKHFKGADVVIIPDMDEPGEKHAKLILRELRNDAQSIRIVNLRRQKATPLPPKGDISDLAGALGAEKAKGVLENLIALSPVLARNIGGGDYEDYFVGVSGCHVRSGCIFSPTAEGDERPLSNFVALPVEQVSIDDGEGQLRQEFVIEGWSSTGMKLKALRVPAESFAKMNWAIEGWGLNAVIYEGNGVAQKLRRIIQSAGVAAAIQRTMYSHTGWREIDGKVCFLHGGGAISAAEAYSDDPNTDKAFADFKADESNKLKLLFCIDMLNEGVHVEGISGVILFRPTISPIVYKQQIGRALTAGDNATPLILDIVNNFEGLCSISGLQDEMQEAVHRLYANGEGDKIITERFEIIEQVHDCRMLFERLQASLSSSWEQYFSEASIYYAEHGNLNIPKRYKTPAGLNLGEWLTTQRKVRAGQKAGNLSEQQIDRLDGIGMDWENRNDSAWRRGLEEAQKFREQFGNLQVPAKYKTKDGYLLGSWIINARQNRILGRLNEKQIAQLDDLDMTWKVFDVRWEQGYALAAAYAQEYGNLDVPRDYKTADGKKLGRWIQSQEQAYEQKKLSEEQISRLEMIGMQWGSRYDRQWNEVYQAAKRYFDAYGNLDVPVAYISPEGYALGKWVLINSSNSMESLFLL